MLVDNQEFKNSLDEAKNKMIGDMLNNVTKACLLVVGEAKERCPVDEGLLRASITYQVEKNSNEIVGYIGSNLDYAPYVEYGTGIYAKDGNGRKTPWIWEGHSKKWKGKFYTKGQKPKAFLEPSVRENLDRINQILGR